MKLKVPFSWWPGHWGLRGEIRDRAKIYYEIDNPYDQELAILKLSIKDARELSLAKLGLDIKYNRIDIIEFEKEKAKIIYKDDERQFNLKMLEIQFRFENMPELTYKKEVATLNSEPWVGILSSSYDKKQGLGGLEFELDWNEFFIIFLTENGYKGVNDQTVVEEWFNDLCKSVVAEDGLDEYLSAMENENLSSTGILPVINKKDLGGDRSEFS